MTTKTIEQQIEQLIRRHLASQQAAIAAAVARSFTPSTPARMARAPIASRRAQSEIAALAEKLFDAVRRNAGETMAVIAPAVGASALELSLPMRHLKRAGRVRSAGKRQFTRYFPMSSSKST